MLVAILLMPVAIAPAMAQQYGSISGIVTSANNANVPDAVVTLWSAEGSSPTLAYVPHNPQNTTDYSSPTPGMYTFTYVPPGTYNVTAMKDGNWFYTTVNMTGGTVTANIVIPYYLEMATPTPTPAPRAQYTYVPINISSPLPRATTRSPGLTTAMALLSMLLAVLVRKRLVK